MLRRRGIKLRDYEPPYRLPEPSSDLAWFLGVLSAGGNIDLTKGRMNLGSIHAGILEKYKLIGERLFSLNARRIPNTKWGYGYEFNSVKATRFIGDLGYDSWAQTILSTHYWIAENPIYCWGFITGFFDKKGRSYSYEPSDKLHSRITLATKSRSGAGLLSELLIRGGIENPNIHYATQSSEEVKDVAIFNLNDTIWFAQHVHSQVPEKERVLEYYRSGSDLRRPKCGRPQTYTTEELIDEWKGIKNTAGGDLTSWSLGKLVKEGKTKISGSTYANRFGQGSFVKAREELERIIAKAISCL